MNLSGKTGSGLHLRKHFLTLGLCILSMLPAFAQTSKWNNPKIDIVFRSLLAQQQLPVQQRKMPVARVANPTTAVVPGQQRMEERYDCIVYTNAPGVLAAKGFTIRSIQPGFVTAWVSLEEMPALAALPEVRYVQAPQIVEAHNDVAVGNTGASLLHKGVVNNTVYKGKGVIVAIFDSGIDWDHPDFRDPVDQTKSRILRIWDQTLTPIAGENSPAVLGYGVEYTQAHINNEIDGTPASYVRTQDVNGHGSHVAGIAAGNGAAQASRKYTGMAPEADIVVVKGGESSFTTTNIINSMTYLQNLSTSLGKPVVLNMSLGGLTGAHDGTRADEIALDNFTSSGPGRVAVVSAGNNNGTLLHTTATVNSAASHTVNFTVPSGTTGTDVFQYTVYVNDNSNVSALLTTPSAENVTAIVGESKSVAVAGGNFTVNLINDIDPANGDRYVNVYITRTAGNPVGTWSLQITNNAASPVTLHGWLNFRNTNYATTSVSTGDNNFLVGSPGNASSAITVASFVGKIGWYSQGANGGFIYTGTTQDNISTFSSIGPRRDGAQKPDLAATGQSVVSVLSSNSTPASTQDVVITGLYSKNQGTSMSSPVVTGAAALLLQAHPTATAAQIKSYLTSNTSSDALTGAVPNNTWGYGRLDVFKAMASSFTCAVDRKTFAYDNPYTSTQDLSAALTTQRIAVRFTPDITGKLGGVFYHTVSNAGAGGTFSLTSFTAEIRSNNAGNPGTLLGTVNVPTNSVALFSWNYLDVSSLNLNVTNGTDYFVVLYAGASSTWGVRRDNTGLVDNRSLVSTDAGSSWSNPGYDYRIRSVVYTHSLVQNGTLAAADATDTRDINSTQQFQSNCTLIAQVVPNGANPVSGSVETKVWIEGSAPTHNNRPYVRRHFEITPATNAATATARVTLYFTQADFTDFNNSPFSSLDLPVDATDALNNKANLRISKLPGSSSDGSGLVGTYTGNATVINPNDNDIVWNAAYNRWEVSFDVTGFSGFVVQTVSFPLLPIVLENFTASKQGASHMLNWKANCGNAAAVFTVERSGDGVRFTTLGSVQASANRCLQPFSWKDEAPLTGANYYRIRMQEAGADTRFSQVLLLQTNAREVTSLQPTALAKGSTVMASFADNGYGLLLVTDAAGKLLYSRNLQQGVQTFNLPIQTAGVYFYRIQNAQGQTKANGKLIVQ